MPCWHSVTVTDSADVELSLPSQTAAVINGSPIQNTKAKKWLIYNPGGAVLLAKFGHYDETYSTDITGGVGAADALKVDAFIAPGSVQSFSYTNHTKVKLRSLSGTISGIAVMYDW